MDLGRIAQIDNAKVENIQKVQKVQESDEKQKVDPNEQHKRALDKQSEQHTEVVLDNVSFGFNKETNDFFIKVKRGNVENKYPTDDMMKLKAALLDSLEAQSIKN
jgi:hypothetical protein